MRLRLVTALVVLFAAWMLIAASCERVTPTPLPKTKTAMVIPTSTERVVVVTATSSKTHTPTITYTPSTTPTVTFTFTPSSTWTPHVQVLVQTPTMNKTPCPQGAMCDAYNNVVNTPTRITK